MCSSELLPICSERVREKTFETGVWSVFGSIPIAEAFARIIPSWGQNLFKHSYGRASPETASASNFALSFQKRNVKIRDKKADLQL